MSLFSYFSLEYRELIIDATLGLLTLVTMGFLGSIISGGYGFFTRVFLGASGVAGLVSIFVGFNSQLGHRLILLSVFLGLSCKVMFFVRHSNKYSYSFKPEPIFVFVLFFALFLASIARMKLSNDGGIPVNAHEAYYLGIPVEINRSDYSSRLRVMDNYPSEWSKYHFFSSSLIAIPMVFMSHQDLAGFLIAKSLILAVFIGAGFELIAGNWAKKTLAFTSLSIIYIHVFDAATKWAVNTTNFLSVILILILFTSIWKNQVFLGCFSSLSLCLSASRLIVPGLALFAFIVFREFRKTDFRSREREHFLHKLWLLLVLVISISCTVLLGETPSNFSSPTRSLYDFVYRAFWTPYYLFTSPDWQTSMTSTTSILAAVQASGIASDAFEATLAIQQQLKEMSNLSILIGLTWWSVLSFVVIRTVWKSKLALFYQFRRITSRSRVLLPFLGLVSLTWFCFCIYRDYSKLLWPLTLSILPNVFVFVLSPSKLRPYIFVYTAAAFSLVPFFDTGVWTPAVSLVEYLLPLFIVIRLSFFMSALSSKWFQTLSVVMLLLTVLPINMIRSVYNPINYDNTTHLINPTGNFKSADIVCSTVTKEDRLLLSLAGQRIPANFEESKSLTVTRNFSIFTETSRETLMKMCSIARND